MSDWIPCQCCGKQYTTHWNWYICDNCGYRICMECYGRHTGPGNGHNSGGGKCSQCPTGWLHLHNGIRSTDVPSSSTNKLDEYLNRIQHQNPVEQPTISDRGTNSFQESPQHQKNSANTAVGLIFTNTEIIAKKYRNTTARQVLDVISGFMLETDMRTGFDWKLIDLGSPEMKDAIAKDATWMDYAQLLSDYADGVGIPKSPHTPLFILGGGDVIPMPEFYASVGNDVKTVEDSDFLYCFPLDYSWKKVSIDDAIFNVARLPLDYVESGTLSFTIEDDIGRYFDRVLNTLENGIPLTYAMMTSNAGKTGRNDWTWTSADVMAKLPQQQLKNDGKLTKDNMFLCPTLDMLGEEYYGNEGASYYKERINNTDMLFINLHGSPNKAMSGYYGAEDMASYCGMSLELMKQIKTPIINTFACYGARYGRYYFDNHDDYMSEYEVYDRDNSMLLTAFYEGNVLVFVGSCTSSICSNVIGHGSVADHLNESTNPIDLLMPAGYAEAMLKLYACYLFKGEPAGYAMLHAKVDYLNYRAKYESKDIVFLTLNQFNVFGCPTLFASAKDAQHQLKESLNKLQISEKELPEVSYKTEYNRLEHGIDGVLHRAQMLVDDNMKLLDDKIRSLLYDDLGITEDDLMRIESMEYNGQQSYNLIYRKQNPLYPEFYIIRTDKNGAVVEILGSR